MNTKIILAVIAGIAIGFGLSSYGAVFLSQSRTTTAAGTVGTQINLTLECKGLEVDLPTLGGDFDAIEQFERNQNIWFKDHVKTYYPRIGLSVSDGLVKMGEAAMPNAVISNASSTRIEFTADAKANTIPFTRFGIINRLTGEVEFHDDLHEGGSASLKLKQQWLFQMPQCTTEILIGCAPPFA
jgi:hypothetical protein